MAWLFSAQARKYINKHAPNLKPVVRSAQGLARLAKQGWNDLEYARTEEGLLYSTESIDRANLLAGYWGAINASRADLDRAIDLEQQALFYKRQLRKVGKRV